MSIFSKFFDSMHVDTGEDDEYDDDYIDDEMDEEPRQSHFSLLKRGGNDEPAETEQRPRIFSRKVTPVRKSALEVALVKPSSFDDAKVIVDDLLENKAVVLNMEGINMDVAQRIIDFTSGASYSMNGKLQKISSYIFIITPENVNLTGDFQDLLSAGAAGSSLDISGLNMHV